MRLSLATVEKFRKAAASSNSTAAAKAAGMTVEWPSYNPKDLKPGILHVGVGNFHRSHMAAYMNDLFNASSANNSWAIVGTGVMAQENAKRSLLKEQDWLQTVVELDGASGKQKATVLASMIDFAPIADDDNHAALYQQLLNENIKIVSLTVTEGGYFMNTEGKLDLDNENIQRDIANPDSPSTTFGLICKALQHRMDNGMAPFTIMSCDNIPHNGHVTKDVVLELAEQMYSPSLKNWIAQHGAFPNSMVDRITPAATQEITDLIERDYGFEDKAPILCEPFRQWVLEDVFVNGERPELESLDTVSIVPDVTPYENMKIRILNGGHASLCYPSALLDLNYVHEAVEHPTIGPFMDVLEKKEIIPTLPPVPDTDLTEYWKIIQGRFANPTLQDTIARNCFDGTNRQPKFIVPVVKDGLVAAAKGGTTSSVSGLALVSAMWSRYCQGTTESGATIAPNDNDWDRLNATAMDAEENPTVWLDQLPHVYGSVGQNPVFREAFTEALNSVHADGVEGAMQKYTAANKN